MAGASYTKPELQIMEVLWNQGACSIREIHEALPAKGRPAFTTVDQDEAKELSAVTKAGIAAFRDLKLPWA